MKETLEELINKLPKHLNGTKRRYKEHLNKYEGFRLFRELNSGWRAEFTNTNGESLPLAQVGNATPEEAVKKLLEYISKN